ncbi:MAG: hypothetical protein NDJ94_13010 [Vicinamibacteria bacterium]|nr:hypothetical protein [Vicinamibacteria bacterium]
MPTKRNATARGTTIGSDVAPRRAPIRRMPFGCPGRLPLPLVPDTELEVLRHVARGPLRRAVEREAQLREGSDRSGPRADWRLS